jgi:2-dehydropantoate 2-reductase
LLALAGHDVEFVVRAGRLAETTPFVLEQVNGGRRDVLDAPRRVAAISPRARAVFVAVRFDQIEASALTDVLRAAPGTAQIIVLTPLLPRQRSVLEAHVGRAIVPAMPGITAYIDERDVARYWLLSVASTLLDDTPSLHAVLDDLARTMDRARIAARLETDVAKLDLGTTVAFFPLIAAIDVGGGIDGVLADKDLLQLAVDAARETEALGKKVGKVASWAYLLTKFVGPFTLKPAILLAKRLAPESVRFVDEHFGPKLHEQHVAMGETVLGLARDAGVAMPSLEALLARLAR